MSHGSRQNPGIKFFILFSSSSNLLYTVYSYAETPTVVVVRFEFKSLGCFFDSAGSLNVLIRCLAIEGTVSRSVSWSLAVHGGVWPTSTRPA